MSQTIPAMRTSDRLLAPLLRCIPQTIPTVLTVQSLYYLFTGIWPLVSIETFEMVTGRKTDHLPTGLENDHWLVMTVGVLVTAIGASLLVAAFRRQANVETIVLAVVSAVGLFGIDVVYVTRRAIPPIYLADAAIEAFLLLAWIYAGLRRQASSAMPHSY